MILSHHSRFDELGHIHTIWNFKKCRMRFWPLKPSCHLQFMYCNSFLKMRVNDLDNLVKLAYGDKDLGLSWFPLLPQLPQKMRLALEVVKSDAKIIILLLQLKSVTHWSKSGNLFRNASECEKRMCKTGCGNSALSLFFPHQKSNLWGFFDWRVTWPTLVFILFLPSNLF